VQGAKSSTTEGATLLAPCCCAFGAHPEGGKGGARAGKPLVQGAGRRCLVKFAKQILQCKRS